MRTETRSTNFAKGLLVSYAATIAAIAFGMWLKPFSLRFLTREEFAIFTLASDLLILTTFLDLGMATSLRAQAAQLLAMNKTEKLSELSSSYFFAQLIAAATILLVGAIISPFASHLLGVRIELQRTTMLTTLILSMAVAFNFAARPFASLLFARQRTQVENSVQLVALALRMLVVIILLLFGWKLFALAAGSLAAAVLTMCFLALGCRRALPDLRLSFKYVPLKSWWRQSGRLSLWFGLGNLAGLAIQSADRIIAAHVIGVEEVTTLVLTGQVYLIAGVLLTQMTSIAMPALGNLIGSDNERAAFTAFRQLFVVSTGAALILAAMLWAGNRAFVGAWVGMINYGGVALDLAFALVLVTTAWTLPFRATLAVSLNARAQARVRLLEAALNLVFSIFFASRLGLVGIMLGTLIAALTTSCWRLPQLVAEYFRRPLGEMLRLLSKPLLAPAVLMATCAYVARWAVATRGGLFGALAAMTMVGIIGVLALWRFGFDAELQIKIKSTLRLLQPSYLRRSV
jgi:O-antigen/teichoic acid export membrane protein